jgi:polyisoprenoid-binding protein YceI
VVEVNETAQCFVYIYREGALSAIGHDLKLVAGDFSFERTGEESVRAECSAAAIEVVGSIDGRSLSEKDRADIKQNMLKDVLDARRFPKISFRSTAISASSIQGVLALRGVEKQIEARLERNAQRIVSKFSIDQTRFGIKPFKALLGALRVKAVVDVEVVLSLGAGA